MPHGSMTASARGLRPVILSLAFAALAGCGGGGGSGDSSWTDGGTPPEAASVEGVYSGTLGDAPSGATHFTTIILENDDIWTVYGQGSGVSTVHGLIQGSGVSTEGSYASSDTADFGSIPTASVSIYADYDAEAGTLDGTMPNEATTTTFSGSRLSTEGYDYEAAASLESITGRWTLLTSQGETLDMNVAADGSLNFSSTGGCGGEGSIAPHASGKNLFDLSITFVDDMACALPGETATGIGLSYPVDGEQQLLLAAVNADRTLGTAAIGTWTDTMEGAYTGSLSGAPSGANRFRAIVLENGDIWALYDDGSDGIFTIDGFIQGSGVADAGSYVSADAADFGLIPAIPGSISGSYDAAAGILSGTIHGEGSTTNYSGERLSGEDYDYEIEASLESITGEWGLMTLQREVLTATVAADGLLNFSSTGGCEGQGSIEPRASGKNIFDLSVTFIDDPICILPGETVTGIAFAYPIDILGQQQLIVMTINAERTLGTAAFGIR